MTEGSFKDLNDNNFAGMARTDTYNFTTRGVSGIGTQAVGIVTNLVPQKPGIGYTSGDTGQVGQCTFDFLLTPAGSIVGIRNISCKDKHTVIPPVTINTKTGLGAQLLPVVSYSPDFVSDIGERPSAGTLVVNVVDCVYSLPKTQVGWVNGNPYYGDFHVHPTTGRKMVGATHVSTPHNIIYNTKEESLGQSAPVTYTQSTTTTPSTPQTDVSDTTTTSQSNTSDTTTPQQTTQPSQPSTQQPYTPPTNNNTNTGGSSGTSGGGY